MSLKTASPEQCFSFTVDTNDGKTEVNLSRTNEASKLYGGAADVIQMCACRGKVEVVPVRRTSL